ncbi:MAG: glycosyltransferase family 39 protein [Candidatus Peribacteraceae bacterium]|nr:glycosyltransferase family 39 protein [Candidatus Peribacteraceae bacterium]MDD5742214.1 glycosyltransferase family 39 protein [Candidatus Peribacteraceae bacterium]
MTRSWSWTAGLLIAVGAVLLWLPGLRLPITSDTTVYALLGESLWRHGTYVFDGLPYAKHLPFHAVVSHPFVFFLGAQAGMKVSTLLAGAGVLLATYLLLRRSFSSAVALLAVIFVLFHHGFVLMMQMGSADLLFTALFLGSLAAFAAAKERPRLYLLAGIFLGLASLTRYNGVPLYALYPAFVFWKRPRHRTSRWFWAGMAVAAGVFGLWFLRNAFVFGNPFHTAYSTEYQAEVPSVWSLFLRNVLYYTGPFHNVLPVLFMLGLCGTVRHVRRQPLLLLGMAAGIALALVWWVKGIRFAFPAYPIFLGFAAAEVRDLWVHGRYFRPLVVLCAVLTVSLHAGALCLYSYGACNAWFDRTIGHIPADLHISSEGLYGISVARDYIDQHAPQHATVLVGKPNFFTWKTGVFRSDLRVVADLEAGCPAYEIEQGQTNLTPLFVTQSKPKTMVLLRECPR